MSAYFCSDRVFLLIATYAATVDASADLVAVQRMLIAANLQSLNCRYPSAQADNIATARAALAAISDRPMLPLPEPGTIASALREYDYQSCEYPSYGDSAAGKLVAKLIDTISEPAADPVDTARAALAAAFAAPSAPEPAPDNRRALVMLLTLARVSAGNPDSMKFSALADRIGAAMDSTARAEASAEASANAAALRSALDAAQCA